MRSFRLIVSKPASGPENMALDEALFESLVNNCGLPTLRLYSWSIPCATIGYFQKFQLLGCCGIPVTRRITGGLFVRHMSDISYSFIASKESWEHLYDQGKTYFYIHSCIKEGLSMLGINCSFNCVTENNSRKSQIGSASDSNGQGNICVNTFYNHDLFYDGKKIVGSCQRKRGANILQQGSIHIDSKHIFLDAANAISEGFKKNLAINFKIFDPEPSELALMDFYVRNKYMTESWNSKF